MRATTPLAQSEAVAFSVLGAAAAIMAAGYLLDALHVRIHPFLLAACAVASAITLYRLVRVHSSEDDRRNLVELVMFASIVGGTAFYLLWLASPSFLPIADGPDIVHHLQLIGVIQRSQSLPHDPRLAAYLSEMTSYTPGSHILAAAIAAWLRVDAVRIVFPVMAVSVAWKAGLVYLVALRTLGRHPLAPFHASVAAVLLAAPVEYFFGSILKFDFYAQIVSETFATGMLLALVAWATGAHRRVWLVMVAVCGVAAFLAWPVWIPAALGTAIVVIGVRRASISVRLVDVSIACGPVIAIAAVHSLRSGGASILGSSGLVTVPSFATLGVMFPILAGAGAILSARDARVHVVLLFAVLIVAQAVALAVANRAIGSGSLYLSYKMVYLLIVPCAVLASIPLARVAALASARGPIVRSLAAVAPVVVVLIAVSRRAPHQRPRSPINESVYAAGLWARDHVPPGCVDYFSRHWLSGYWLHLDVLGNPRVSDRMKAETFEFSDAAAKWIQGQALPYAIVEDLTAVPHEARADMDPIYRVHAAAVVRHIRPLPCPDPAVPIQAIQP